MKTRQAFSALAMTMVCVIAGSGCQEKANRTEPSPTTPDQSNPESSGPTPSDERPTMPEVATDKTPRGAKAFVEHYYDLANYGRATGQWDPLKDLSLPSCTQCADFWSESPNRFDSETRIAIRTGPEIGRFNNPRTAVSLLISTATDLDSAERKEGKEWADLVWLDYRDHSWMVKTIEVDKLYDGE